MASPINEGPPHVGQFNVDVDDRFKAIFQVHEQDKGHQMHWENDFIRIGDQNIGDPNIGDRNIGIPKIGDTNIGRPQHRGCPILGMPCLWGYPTNQEPTTWGTPKVDIISPMILGTQSLGSGSLFGE